MTSEDPEVVMGLVAVLGQGLDSHPYKLRGVPSDPFIWAGPIDIAETEKVNSKRHQSETLPTRQK